MYISLYINYITIFFIIYTNFIIYIKRTLYKYIILIHSDYSVCDVVMNYIHMTLYCLGGRIHFTRQKNIRILFYDNLMTTYIYI